MRQVGMERMQQRAKPRPNDGRGGLGGKVQGRERVAVCAIYRACGARASPGAADQNGRGEHRGQLRRPCGQRRGGLQAELRVFDTKQRIEPGCTLFKQQRVSRSGRQQPGRDKPMTDPRASWTDLDHRIDRGRCDEPTFNGELAEAGRSALDRADHAPAQMDDRSLPVVVQRQRPVDSRSKALRENVSEGCVSQPS